MNYMYKVKRKRLIEEEYRRNLKNSKKSWQPAKVISTKVIHNPSFKEKYHNFLKSDFWLSARQKILEKNDGCVICGSKEGINLHHISYEDVYCRKPETSPNIVVICQYHHEKFHKKYKLHKNMRKSWKSFLRKES